jgi:hypothetical protein
MTFFFRLQTALFDIKLVEMNWTEGSLARHSRRRGWNEEAQRQKKHFDKVRARKEQNISRSAPFVPSYITQAQEMSILSTSSSRPSPKGHAQTKKQLIHLTKDGVGLFSSDKQSSSPGFSTTSLEYKGETGHADSAIQKRRRLLQKSDWTGVEFQRPPPIQHLWQRSNSQKQCHDLRMHGRAGHKLSLEARNTSQICKHREDDRSDGHLRIRIGSQDFR